MQDSRQLQVWAERSFLPYAAGALADFDEHQLTWMGGAPTLRMLYTKIIQSSFTQCPTPPATQAFQFGSPGCGKNPPSGCCSGIGTSGAC